MVMHPQVSQPIGISYQNGGNEGGYSQYMTVADMSGL